MDRNPCLLPSSEGRYIGFYTWTFNVTVADRMIVGCLRRHTSVNLGHTAEARVTIYDQESRGVPADGGERGMSAEGAAREGPGGRCAAGWLLLAGYSMGYSSLQRNLGELLWRRFRYH